MYLIVIILKCVFLHIQISYFVQANDKNLPHYICVDDNSAAATMITSSLLVFRDIDMENLQYLANESLATPANGNMLETNINITLAEQVLDLEQVCYSSQSCAPLVG